MSDQPVGDQPVGRTGSALIWRTVQMGGTKVIFLVRLLVLARLLTPDDFGLVTIGVSAIAFLMSVTNFGMVEALVQGEDADEQRYHAAWTINVSRAFIVSFGVFIFAPLVAQIFDEPRSVNIVRVLAFRPLLDALASMKVAGLTRNLHFRPLAILNLINGLSNLVVSIVLALFFGVWGLVIGALAGSAAYLIVSYIVAPYRPKLVFDREIARPLLQFGRWIYLTSLVVMIGGNVLQVAISRQLGAAELGLYYLATQIAFLPYEVAREVVGSVAFPLYSRLQKNLAQAVVTFRAVFASMAALLYPICALIIALAPTLVEEVLGDGWEGTAPIIRVLTLAAVIGLLADTTAPVFQGLGKPNRITVVELVQSLILIASVWTLAASFGVVGAAAAWIPAYLAAQIVSAYFLVKMLDRPFSGLAKPLLAITLVSIISALAAAAIDSFINGLVGFILAAGISAAIALGLTLAFEKWFDLGLFGKLAMFFPQIGRIIGLAPAEIEATSG